MKLTIRNIETPITIGYDAITTLVIENKNFFREILADLVQIYTEHKELATSIHSDDEALNKDLLLVTDVFGFDFSAKKLITELYKQAAHAIDNDTILVLNTIETELQKLAVFAEDTLEIALEHKETIDIVDMLKVFKVQPLLTHSYNPKERAYGIIDVASRLFPRCIVCFVNIKQLLTKDEFLEISRYCMYKKQRVWCLESTNTYKVADENIVVVDDDLFCYNG